MAVQPIGLNGVFGINYFVGKTMATQLFPLLGEQSTTKESVIRILSQEWPLTTKEIYRKISKENNKTISYQAVHKTLNQLSDQHILTKQNRVYQLNPQWITNIKNLGETLDYQYSNESGKLKLPNDLSKPIRIEFKDASSLPVTLANLFASTTLTNGQPFPVYGLFKHGLWPLRFNFLDFDLLLRMTKRINGGYAAIVGSLPFDHWIAKHYLAGGLNKSKAGIKTNIQEDAAFAQGEIVVQVEYNPETAKLIEGLYQEMESLSDLFKLYISKKVSQHPYRATVTIQKNPLLANLLREKITGLLE